jgi:hypothetical protein
MAFDYEGAKNAGYSDDEILQHLSSLNTNYDTQSALKSGYTPEEVNQHLLSFKEEEKPERSLLEQGGRLAGQFALGAAENALLPYEISVAPLASQSAQNIAYRQNIGEDIERLMEQKVTGIWDERDEEMLNDLIRQIQDPRESEKFVQTTDLGIRSLAEKATGLNLKPEGILEHAANWMGFIKNPKNVKKVIETGLKPGELIKSVLPTGTELLRGLGAGTALQMAEEGEFGPIGTMAAVVAGDIAGAGTAGIIKGGKQLITQPKQTLAKIAASFTPSAKKELQKEIIEDFRKSGIQADLGTITDSNLIKMTQSRLAQSGLTGKALEDFKETLTTQIKDEYKSLADSLGEAKFATQHEAGEATKQALKDIRDADLAETRQLYKNANNALKEGAAVDSRKLADSISKIEKDLTPGRIKSPEQNKVLDALQRLKQDIYDSEGNLLYANVKDLMNNKIALNDIINYEVQGGSKQLLKGVVSELDRAIISHGKENASFAKNYIQANKRFSEHAKTFRNKSVNQLLTSMDPAQILNKMNTVQGIRSLNEVFKKSSEGRKIFDNLKRLKLDKIVGDNLIDSTSQQAKLGTFSKLLEKGKNKEIIQEILGPNSFKRLQRLQKNAGALADTFNKFLNASKSGTSVVDVAIIGKILNDLTNIFYGNPWPIMKTAGGFLAIKKLTKLLADPEFLKIVEDIILASKKRSDTDLLLSISKLRPYAQLVYGQNDREIQE